jgi:hypothetical protein
VLALRSKNIVSKIVQICALFASREPFLHLIDLAERHHDRQAFCWR